MGDSSKLDPAPEELRRQVVAAARRYQRWDLPSSHELRDEAALVMTLASHFAGREDHFLDFLLPGRLLDDGFIEEWMWNLASDLARAGMVDEAVAVSDAFARLDEDDAGNHGCNAATALAQAGRREEALARIEANLRAFGRDQLVLIASAQAYAALGELREATDLHRRAIDLAEERGDPEEVHSAYEWFETFLEEHPGVGEDADSKEGLQARFAAWRRRTGWVVAEARWSPGRSGPKVGRNEPCPCGSGLKFKRCCGRAQ